MNAWLGIVVRVLAALFILWVVVLPLRWAARAMNARHSGFGWCLLAMICASILQAIGSAVFMGGGNLLAFLCSALAFAAILGTDFLRGIGLALLHILFTALLVGLFLLIMMMLA